MFSYPVRVLIWLQIHNNVDSILGLRQIHPISSYFTNFPLSGNPCLLKTLPHWGTISLPSVFHYESFSRPTPMKICLSGYVSHYTVCCVFSL